MSLYPPPQPVTPAVFTRLPDAFRHKRATAWAAANRGGEPVDCFLEGPSFDRAGNLWVVDIPFGRIFRIDGQGQWSQVAGYDGWPNGLKIHRDGSILVADYRRGLLRLDPASGAVTPLLETRHSEAFKGVNDLFFAASGDLYFTDQGQTGHQDPTGRVFRLRPDGRLDLLLATVPSPNGLVTDRREGALYLAVTRANAVWRLPFMPDGTVSKVGTFIQLSGGLGGPDGMALDEEGGLVVAHLGMGAWRFDALGRPTHHIWEDRGEGGHFVTNVAFGGPDRRTLYLVDSGTGTILTAPLPVPGRAMFSHA
jgi:gluconolactonase